jgi:hypothetical protein
MSDSGQVPGWPASDGAPLPPPPPPAAPYDPYATVGPPAYGAPTPQPYGPPQKPMGKTNGMAIASLACSLGGIFGGLITCGLLAPAIIVGIVLGHVALSQIKRTGQEGRGLALGGIISGYAVIGLSVLAIVLGVIFGDSSSGT